MEVEQLLAKVSDNDDAAKSSLNSKIAHLNRIKWMTEYYDKVAELSKKMTAWSMTDGLKLSHSSPGVTRYHENSAVNTCSVSDEDLVPIKKDSCIRQAIVVCTGGGPGFMEAASKGSSEIPGSRTVGMGISLPFEKGLNPHVSKELAFEYHYFFTRKLWMVFYCQALVVAPGGVGTLDEMFEILTLRQTGKIQKELPIVLLGKEFWENVVNWKYLVQMGVLNEGGMYLSVLV